MIRLFRSGIRRWRKSWSVLGYDQKAKDEAKKAFELSANLSFEDRTSIEGRYRGIASDWPAAIRSITNKLYDYSQNRNSITA